MHIKIDLKIFAFIILFCLTHQIELYAILMLFALLHELGHLVVGLILKLKPKKMELNPLGLSITFEGIGKKFNKSIPQKRILIAIAGPIVNLLLIFLAFLIPVSVSREIIIYSNIMLLLVNLLPIYPLDGGRILKNVLQIHFGYWSSVETTHKISNVITVILTIVASISIFYFENIAILFILIYLWVLILKENQRYILIRKTYSILEKDTITLEKV